MISPSNVISTRPPFGMTGRREDLSAAPVGLTCPPPLARQRTPSGHAYRNPRYFDSALSPARDYPGIVGSGDHQVWPSARLEKTGDKVGLPYCERAGIVRDCYGNSDQVLNVSALPEP